MHSYGSSKVQDRFESKFTPEPNTGCWLWLGYVDKIGYGVFSIKSLNYKAHRVAYELFKGVIPKGLCVMHICDNMICVNPSHLVLGTQLENIKDRDSKGRMFSKLTPRDVLEIRERYVPRKVTQQSLAEEYGVSRRAVGHLLKGATWKNVY